MMIKQPGIIYEMPSSIYFEDPCPEPSFTQSLAKILIAGESPLHAWTKHPRLNPNFERDDDTKFDVGNIAHSLLLGRGRDIVVLPAEYEDWRKSKPRELRDEYAAEGKHAVLAHDAEIAGKMVKRAKQTLTLPHGAAEVCVAWREREIWLRQLVDWLSADFRTILDYKTTERGRLTDQILASKKADDGWHIQAAMTDRGLNLLDPDNIGRRRYLYVIQEAHEPYELRVIEMTPGDLTIGRKQLDYAIAVWADCMANDAFPGYAPGPVTLEIPSWYESQWLNQEVARESQHEPITDIV